MATDRIKLNMQSWDSDKDPNIFGEWAGNVSSLVKSTSDGIELERFLDRKLNRDATSTKMVPTWLAGDSDFTRPIDPSTGSSSKAIEATPTPKGKKTDPSKNPWESAGESPRTPASNPRLSMGSSLGSSKPIVPVAVNYFDLSNGAQKLDALMYNVLKLHIKGSKKHLLESTAFESYVQAMMILDKHCDISGTDRKTKALAALEGLEFKGDVQTWQIDCIRRIKELMDSKVTLLDFALLSVMKSLNGKSKTVQYKIAEKINSGEIDSVEKIYDLLQDYASVMASVGDGGSNKQGKVNQVGDDTKGNFACTRCGRDGHTAKKCFAKVHKKTGKTLDPKTASQKTGGGKGGGGGTQHTQRQTPGEFKGKCDNCGEVGHKKADCKKPPKSSDNKTFTVAELGDMMDKIKTGKVKTVQVSMVLQDDYGNAMFDLDATNGEIAITDLDDCHMDIGCNSATQASMELAVIDIEEGHLSIGCNTVHQVSSLDTLVDNQNSNQNMGLDGTSMPKSLGIADTMPLVCRYHGQVYKTTVADSVNGASKLQTVANLMMCNTHWEQGVELYNATALCILEDGYYPDDHQVDGKMPSIPYCHLVRNVFMAKPEAKPATSKLQPVGDKIMMSLFGGMDCLAIMAKQLNINPSRYISVESNPSARKISALAHPKAGDFVGVDHTWNSDILFVTESDIADLGRNNIGFVGAGPPCEDFSKLRLLPARHAGDIRKVPRPGLEGSKGALFRKFVVVLGWIRKYNPQVKYLVECVVFDDMVDDWNEVNTAIGVEPFIVDSCDVSYTKRKRAYWTNIAMQASDLTGNSLDGDDCMDDGRTLQRCGKAQIVRTIGKSWKGSADSPVADTNLPVLVKDVACSELVHLRPHEAEKLMGMSGDVTDQKGVTALQRLTCIGNGWDILVTSRFMLRYRESLHSVEDSKHCEHSKSLTREQQLMQCSIVALHGSLSEPDFLKMMADQTKENQLMFMELLADWFKDHPSQVHAVAKDQSILDSGSGVHLNSDVEVQDPNDVINLSGFNKSKSKTEGSGTFDLHL
jgi:hypothetical protein